MILSHRFSAGFRRSLPGSAGKASSHLRLAAPAIASREHIPAVIAGLGKNRPEMELTLIESGQHRVFGLLPREEVDLAIAEIDVKIPPGIRHEILTSLPLVLLLPPGLSMPDGGIAALAGSQPLVRLPDHTAISRLFAKGLAKQSIHWPSRIEVSTFDLVGAYVSQGFGVGVSVRVPGVKAAKGVSMVDLDDFPEIVIAGLWRGKIHPLAAEVLAGLRDLAAR